MQSKLREYSQILGMTFFLFHKYNTKLASSIETTSKYILLPCPVRAKSNDMGAGVRGRILSMLGYLSREDLI